MNDTPSIVVRLTGPDAERALAELISNAQYDALNVTIAIERTTTPIEPETQYAAVAWTRDDVLALRPTWTTEQAETFLSRNEKYLQERLSELGYDAIATYLDMDDAEQKQK